FLLETDGSAHVDRHEGERVGEELGGTKKGGRRKVRTLTRWYWFSERKETQLYGFGASLLPAQGDFSSELQVIPLVNGSARPGGKGTDGEGGGGERRGEREGGRRKVRTLTRWYWFSERKETQLYGFGASLLPAQGDFSSELQVIPLVNGSARPGGNWEE